MLEYNFHVPSSNWQWRYVHDRSVFSRHRHTPNHESHVVRNRTIGCVGIENRRARPYWSFRSPCTCTSNKWDKCWHCDNHNSGRRHNRSNQYPIQIHVRWVGRMREYWRQRNVFGRGDVKRWPQYQFWSANVFGWPIGNHLNYWRIDIADIFRRRYENSEWWRKIPGDKINSWPCCYCCDCC